MPRCVLHDVTFYAPHGSAGSVYTCRRCGLVVTMHHYPDGMGGSVSVKVTQPRKWLAQLFHDIARWMEGGA